MSGRSEFRRADGDFVETMWAATQFADDARNRLMPAGCDEQGRCKTRPHDYDDEEEQHDSQPNAPWAGWFWVAVWAVIAAASLGIWLAPWLADKVIP